MSERVILQPLYFKEFMCITDRCKENCCRHDWQIQIDKATYDKYTRLNGDDWRKLCENIRVISQDPFKAELLFGADGGCKFLDDAGRCSIHLKYGHDYLSHTCKVYPRKYCNVAGDSEAYLELSCEAVSDLVLFDEDLMEFERVLYEGDEPITYHRTLEAHRYSYSENAAGIFWELRSASIAIAQYRRYSLQFRMVILGMFISQTAELLVAGRDSEIEGLAKVFVDRLDTGAYDDFIDQVQGGGELGIEFILRMVSSMESSVNKVLIRCLDQARAGFGLTPGIEIAADFADDYKKHYETYFADKESILEHFIVQHIFSYGFPFNYRYTDNIMSNYNELLVKLNLIKFLLVGMCRYHGGFNRERIVECVSSFSGVFDHNISGALVIE